jgi:O-antigen/teichoic acid export membrane protein
VVSGVIGATMSEDAAGLSSTIFGLLALYSLAQTTMMPFGAITGHVLSVHGRFPRIAAWGLFQAGLVLAAPTVAVLLGGGLMAAGLALIGAHVLAGLLSVLDMMRLARGHWLLLRQPIDWRMGARNALLCLPLAGRGFIESFRQQGFRILLGAYAGPAAVAALATTRTFANALHQGLGTTTAPLLPELMRYIVARDQTRMEGAFAVVWLCLFALLVPGVLLLAAVAEPLFLLWTRGAVAFDPVLFLTLLVVVLIYAASQPAMAILQGYNRIAWMISAAVAAAAGLGILALALVPPLGLRGAGFALLGAELCALVVTVAGASRTLGASGLVFPMRGFALAAGAAAAVLVLGLPAVTLWTGAPWAMALPFAANAALGWFYWATIPALARDRIRAVLATLPARLPVAAHTGAEGPE